QLEREQAEAKALLETERAAAKSALDKTQRRYEAVLEQRWKPEEMLTFWLPLVQNSRDRKDLSDNALRDVERVLANPGLGDVHKSKALLVRGLSLRNDARYADAQKDLSKAAEGLEKTGGPWQATAFDALLEVSDPVGYYAA